MDLKPIGHVRKLFSSINHSLRVDSCVGFYGYDGSELGQAYLGAQIPESRISSLDVSKVKVERDSSAIRYGGPLVFHGIVTKNGFEPVKRGILPSRYRWQNQSPSHKVQMITLNALFAVISDENTDGRVFVDKVSIADDLLTDLEKTMIPETYKMSLYMIERWRGEKEKTLKRN